MLELVNTGKDTSVPGYKVKAVAAPPTALGSFTLIGTTIYLFSLTELWAYSITADTWTKKAGFPGALRAAHEGLAANGKLYIIGGWNGSANIGDCWCYDPATDVWTSIAAIAAVSGHRGYTATYSGEECLFIIHTNATLLRYRPSLNTWTQVAASYTPVVSQAWVYCSPVGKAYGYGGVSLSSGLPLGALQTSDGTSYAEATVTQGTPNPGLKAYPAIATSNSKIYVRASGTTASAVDNDLWEFTISTGVWRKLPSGGVRTRQAQMVCYNNKLYIFGGTNINGAQLNQLWELDLAILAA